MHAMDSLPMTPAFRTYALCCAILALKMLFSAVYTGTRRQASQGYINPEDARTFGREDARAAASESPEVAHALRIQRNDIENIPIFFAVGLVYVLAGAPALGAAAYFWTYTIARVAHTIAYIRHIQPLRAICWIVGSLCVVGMCVQLILQLL
jgi:microsomal prostaglandin-E synthase 1